MSTLVLTKDHPKHGKKGSRISAPFLEARDLVAAGLAERWNGGLPAPAEAPATVSQEAYEKAGKRIGELEEQVKRLQTEAAASAAEAGKATARAEKAETEVKSLTEQLAAARKANAK